MRILKDLVFSQVKAYNLVQMFNFIMERYYQSKIISIAHTHVDRFISIRYRGLNAKAYTKDSITQLSECCFSLPSKQKRGVSYQVNMEIGICTCTKGQDGSPCSHQAAVAVCCGCPNINCIPVLDPDSKQTLIYIAYDKDSVQDLFFYATLSNPLPSVHERPKDPSETDFSASCWNHIRLGAVN